MSGKDFVRDVVLLEKLFNPALLVDLLSRIGIEDNSKRLREVNVTNLDTLETF